MMSSSAGSRPATCFSPRSTGTLVETLAEWSCKKHESRRRSPAHVFKSVGIALEDVAVAAFVYEQATPGRSSAGPSPATR